VISFIKGKVLKY